MFVRIGSLGWKVLIEEDELNIKDDEEEHGN
jgi:hypothetical protein